MEIIGFKVTRDEYEAKSKELVDELERIISDSENVVLQVVLTWDEFATMLPELLTELLNMGGWDPYSYGYLSPPAKDLHRGGTFKGVELYYKDRNA